MRKRRRVAGREREKDLEKKKSLFLIGCEKSVWVFKYCVA